MATFRKPPRPPSPFTFTAVAPSYEVYGWRVSIDRPALEFSTLENAGPSGFTLAGSGRVTVTTAPIFKPGATYPVTVGAQGEDLRPDGEGRLEIVVPLGPGNPSQEYTTGAETKVFRTRVRIAGASGQPRTGSRHARRHRRHHRHRRQHA